MSDGYELTIFGLLRRRQELTDESTQLRERIASIVNDVEAIDRVLESLRHTEPLENRGPRQTRIMLFYRNELRDFLIKELGKASEPVTSRQLAEILCQAEGKTSQDKRLLKDVVQRCSKSLCQLRDMGRVKSELDRKGVAKWALAFRPCSN